MRVRASVCVRKEKKKIVGRKVLSIIVVVIVVVIIIIVKFKNRFLHDRPRVIINTINALMFVALLKMVLVLLQTAISTSVGILWLLVLVVLLIFAPSSIINRNGRP